MKRYKIIIFILLVFSIISCVNKEKKENLPLIIRADSLSTTHLVKVIDTTDGILSKAEFIDRNDTTKKIQKQYWENGNVYIEGELIKEKRNGLWKAWYDNGHLWSIGNYVNGEKEGLEETYYPNGNVRYSIIYKNGKEEGMARYYSNKGELIIERVFESGNLISEKLIEENKN